MPRGPGRDPRRGSAESLPELERRLAASLAALADGLPPWDELPPSSQADARAAEEMKKVDRGEDEP